MINLRAGGRFVAIDIDDLRAAYTPVEHLGATRPARASARGLSSVRALVEVRRNFGGMVPSALLGGEFIPSASTETVYDVLVGSEYELMAVHNARASREISSRMENGRGFIAGLPKDYASAVLGGIVSYNGSSVIPAGVFCVDRAGFDEIDSSASIFRLAAQMLRGVISELLTGGDGSVVANRLMLGWA